LMGTVVYLTLSEGKTDCYVLCWFDGAELDMAKDFCQLRGVAFAGAVTCGINERNQKWIYNARFSTVQVQLRLIIKQLDR